MRKILQNFKTIMIDILRLVEYDNKKTLGEYYETIWD